MTRVENAPNLLFVFGHAPGKLRLGDARPAKRLQHRDFGSDLCLDSDGNETLSLRLRVWNCPAAHRIGKQGQSQRLLRWRKRIGLLSPTRGTVRFDGQDLAALSERALARQRIPDLTLRVIGDGPERKKVNRIVACSSAELA